MLMNLKYLNYPVLWADIKNNVFSWTRIAYLARNWCVFNKWEQFKEGFAVTMMDVGSA